jgi:23S rRNA (uracil1939-C5)-methyltransferase
LAGVTLNILEMGARGDGIAEEEGRRYFVPFTLPGEIVEAEPGEERGGGVTATLTEILGPSRHRVAPPCKHFGTCGGCALQHWRRDIYLDWKIGLISRALSQAGVKAPGFEPALATEPNERRRADFSVRGRVAGFHERGSPRAFDVEECHVVMPKLLALLPALRGLMPGDVPLDAIVNDTDTGLDVLLRPHKRLKLSLEANQKLVGAASTAGLARLSWGDRANPDPIASLQTPSLTYNGVTIEPPPGVFLQATRRAEQTMREAAAEWIGKAKSVADLFAGIGALSAGQPWKATLFESDKAAVAAADAAGRKLGGARLTAVKRDLFRNALTPLELKSFDAVILDPPRAGAAAQCAELAQSKVSRIVYASCDPGSFARDARALQDAGYRLEKLKPIDQFLWSGHVELISLFVRGDAR